MDDISLLEAIEFARSRKVLLPSDYYKLDVATRRYAATVSQLATIDQIQTVLDAVHKTLKDGGTFNDFQKLVEAGDIKLSKNHLDNIFRTNIQNAYAHGRWQHQQSNKEKRQYLMYWAIEDSRTRPGHLKLHRIIRHIDDAFWKTFYPPNGYRCFLPETKIDGASHGAIKRFYSGKIVKLVTKSGRELRVTANHPILTSRGWVIAELIKQGDNLIAYDRPVESLNANGLTRKVYNDEFVPTAENLFKTFVGHALTIGKASSFKLNGNLFASDSEIHIDVIDDGLSIKIDSNEGKGVEQRMFVIRNDGTCFETIKACGTPDSGCVVADIVLSQDAINITGRGVEGSSDFTLADILRLIEIEDSKLQLSIGVPTGIPGSRALTLNSTWSLFDGLPLDRFGLASSSQDNTLFEELSSNGLSDDSGLFGYLINTHASHVATDPVINVIEDSYSGHVYDFQSDSGLLSADGIITHNCRCTVIALTEKQALKYGITPDDQLPDVSIIDKGWNFNPGEYDRHALKILESRMIREIGNQPVYDLLQAQQLELQLDMQADDAIVKAMPNIQPDLFEDVVSKTVSKGVEVRPSDLVMTIGLSDSDNSLTDLVKTSALQKDQDSSIGKRILDKIQRAFNRVFAIAKNTKSKLTGNSIHGLDGLNLSPGNIIGVVTPTLFKTAQNAGKNITILDAKGVAIDLSKISGLDGALLAPDLNLEVVSIDDNGLVLKRTNEDATRYFVANQTVFSLG